MPWHQEHNTMSLAAQSGVQGTNHEAMMPLLQSKGIKNHYLLFGTMLSSIYPKAFMDSNIKATLPVCQLQKHITK